MCMKKQELSSDPRLKLETGACAQVRTGFVPPARPGNPTLGPVEGPLEKRILFSTNEAIMCMKTNKTQANCRANWWTFTSN